ncbi:HNH endonuclease [Candidatus Woesearchaeota archaeon]|nr:HNH endonuclease [Candidatus Woesearchaeota archaeon]
MYGRCVYCNSSYLELITVDHIVPVSSRKKYGLSFNQVDDPSNKVPACRSCNVRKHNKTLEQFLNEHPGYRNNFIHNILHPKDKSVGLPSPSRGILKLAGVELHAYQEMYF